MKIPQPNPIFIKGSQEQTDDESDPVTRKYHGLLFLVDDPIESEFADVCRRFRKNAKMLD